MPPATMRRELRARRVGHQHGGVDAVRVAGPVLLHVAEDADDLRRRRKRLRRLRREAVLADGVLAGEEPAREASSISTAGLRILSSSRSPGRATGALPWKQGIPASTM